LKRKRGKSTKGGNLDGARGYHLDQGANETGSKEEHRVAYFKINPAIRKVEGFDLIGKISTKGRLQ